MSVYKFFYWPPRGSMKLVFIKLTNLVSLEQFHHKPIGMYDSGLWWNSSNDTWFISLVGMSFTDPRGDLNAEVEIALATDKVHRQTYLHDLSTTPLFVPCESRVHVVTPLSLILCSIFQRLVSKILVNPVFLLLICSGHLVISKKCNFIQKALHLPDRHTDRQTDSGAHKLTMQCAQVG